MPNDLRNSLGRLRGDCREQGRGDEPGRVAGVEPAGALLINLEVQAAEACVMSADRPQRRVSAVPDGAADVIRVAFT